MSLLVLFVLAPAPVSDQGEQNNITEESEMSDINISMNDKSDILQASAFSKETVELPESESLNTIDAEGMFFQTSDIDHFIY